MSKEEIKSENKPSEIPKEKLQESPINLTDKDIKYREKYKQKVQEFEQLNIQSQTKEKELSEKIQSATTEKNTLVQKLVAAKLESAAISAGIADPDFVKLIDNSKLKVTDSGDIEGLSEAINELKTNKPHCFSQSQTQTKKVSSSTNSGLGTSTADGKPADAWSMTKEEFQRKAGISY